MCVFITAAPNTKLFGGTRGEAESTGIKRGKIMFSSSRLFFLKRSEWIPACF
jgi:hypothetical protein